MSQAPDDERTWQEIARDDAWLAEATAKIASACFDVSDERSIKPAVILQPAFAAAKVLQKSVRKTAVLSESQREALKSLVHLGRESPPMKVSLGAIDRVLRLINFIIHHCEIYGIRAGMDEKRYIIVSKDVARVRLSFNERFDDVYIAPEVRATKNKPTTGRRISQGTGELSITIYGSGPSRRITDKGDEHLEAQFRKILSKIALAVAETNACRKFLERRIAETHTAALAKSIEVARQKRLAEQTEEFRAAEIKRKTDLVAEAAAWAQAAAIRSYTAHIEDQLNRWSGNMDLNLLSWLQWTAAMADELDPTTRRLRGDDQDSKPDTMA